MKRLEQLPQLLGLLLLLVMRKLLVKQKKQLELILRLVELMLLKPH